jgi:hypothetical protein
VEIKTGARMRSQVCDTEVVVIRAPAAGNELQCGGKPMVELSSPEGKIGEPISGFDGGTQLGKRYAVAGDDESIELLVTKAGRGSLSLDGIVLSTKEPKPLPSSD